MMDALLQIVAYEDEQNLTKITWSQRFLEQVKTEYKLKHKQAVLFTNKAEDRFRLVACFYGLAVLVLPPTEPEQRLSLYLKVGQFLRRFSNTEKMNTYLSNEIELTKDRIERRASVAKSVSKNRK
jgi:hypothetical protein